LKRKEPWLQELPWFKTSTELTTFKVCHTRAGQKYTRCGRNLAALVDNDRQLL
jgi:hypothetical protein